MKYCINIFGQFRTFKLNLEANLEVLYDSIIKDNEIDIFILTDKCGNYSIENEEIMFKIFNKYNCNIKFIKFWENCSQYHEQEKKVENNYKNNCKHNRGKQKFTANLWYRRHILNELKNKYCSENNIKYDLHIFIRLFDIIIKPNLNNQIIRNQIEKCLYENKLLMSIDTIFIGNKEITDYIFSFGENFNLYHDDIWNNKKLCEYFKQIDDCLYNLKPMYCSEVQIYSHIFFSNFVYQNIRVDFNKLKCSLNKSALFHVKLCNYRKKI